MKKILFVFNLVLLLCISCKQKEFGYPAIENTFCVLNSLHNSRMGERKYINRQTVYTNLLSYRYPLFG